MEVSYVGMRVMRRVQYTYLVTFSSDVRILRRCCFVAANMSDTVLQEKARELNTQVIESPVVGNKRQSIRSRWELISFSGA